MLKIAIIADRALHDDITARVRAALRPHAYEVRVTGGKEHIPPSELQRGMAHRATELDPDKGRFRVERAEHAVNVFWRDIPEMRSILAPALAGLKHRLHEPQQQVEAESAYRHAKIQDRDSQTRADAVRLLRESGYEFLAKDLEEPDPSEGSSAKPIGKA